MSDVQSVTFNEFDAAMTEQAEKVRAMPSTIPPLTNVNIGNIYSDMLIKGLEDGTSPFLPKNGVIDLKPAYNMASNSLHKNVAQIEFQLDAAKHGYKDLGYVSYDTLNAARKAAAEKGEVCSFKPGSIPVSTFIVPRDEQGNPQKEKEIKWYNASQIENLPFLKNFCKEKMTRETEKTNNFIREQKEAGNPAYENISFKKNPAEYDMSAPNTKTLSYSGKYASDYLGQILAAMSSGTKLLVDEPIAKTMADYMITEINKKTIGKNGKELARGIVFNQFVATANKKCKTSLAMLKNPKTMEAYQAYKEKQDLKQQQKQQRQLKKEPSCDYDRGR